MVSSRCPVYYAVGLVQIMRYYSQLQVPSISGIELVQIMRYYYCQLQVPSTVNDLNDISNIQVYSLCLVMAEGESGKKSLSLNTCCCCISLDKGTRTIGTSFFLITLGTVHMVEYITLNNTWYSTIHFKTLGPVHMVQYTTLHNTWYSTLLFITPGTVQLVEYTTLHNTWQSKLLFVTLSTTVQQVQYTILLKSRYSKSRTVTALILIKCQL